MLLEEEAAEKERIIMKHAIDSEEKAEDTTSIFFKKLSVHREAGASGARGGLGETSGSYGGTWFLCFVLLSLLRSCSLASSFFPN